MKIKPGRMMIATILALALCLPDIAYAVNKGVPVVMTESKETVGITEAKAQSNAVEDFASVYGVNKASNSKEDNEEEPGTNVQGSTEEHTIGEPGTNAQSSTEEHSIGEPETNAQSNTEEHPGGESETNAESNTDEFTGESETQGEGNTDQSVSQTERHEENNTEKQHTVEAESNEETKIQDTSNAEQAEKIIFRFSEHVSGEFLDGVLTITGKGEIPDLSMYEDNPLNDIQTKIKSIIIDEGITVIGDYTFRNCRNAEVLQLPASLKTIGKYAFAENYCLSKIQLPDNLQIIKEGAFSKDINLMVENFPDTLQKIESYAFFNCFKIRKKDAELKKIKINEDAFFQYPRYVKLEIQSYSKTNDSGKPNFVGSLYYNAYQMTQELQEAELQKLLEKRSGSSGKSGERYKDLKSYYDDIIQKNYPDAKIKYSVSLVDKNAGLKKSISPFSASTRNASNQAELEAAIKQSGSGDVINITKNMTLKNVVITNKNVTIRASGGNRTITPANGNNVTAFILNGNSKVTFAATGTHTASNGSAAANKLYIGASATKGTGNCINSSNIIVQGTARVTINGNVLVRNSRYHTVYGDPNTTIVLNGGSLMNTAEVTAVNGGGNTFGIGSYGTILIKSGKIYCESTKRKMQYGQGVHSNGGTIEVTGGSIR